MGKLIDDKNLIERVLDKLDKIDDKVDKLDKRLDSAEIIATKQEHNLELHMKRSDLLEKSQGNLEEAIKPILKTYTVIWGICKIVMGISIIVGIIGGVVRIYNGM